MEFLLKLNTYKNMLQGDLLTKHFIADCYSATAKKTFTFRVEEFLLFAIINHNRFVPVRFIIKNVKYIRGENSLQIGGLTLFIVFGKLL